MSFVDVLTPTLGRLQAKYEQSPLPRFFAWWLGELRGLLPARWRERLAAQEAELWLQIDADELVVSRIHAGVCSEHARLPLQPPAELPQRLGQALDEQLADLRRTLLLPTPQVLRRRLNLPAVARDKLRTMLAFELDRQTPFRPEQVYFDSRILPHAANARQLPVELVLVQREALEQQMQRLGGLAAALDGIDVLDGERRLGCNFLAVERRRRRDRRGLWINLGLIAASALVLILAMGQVVANRQAALEQIKQEVEQQRAAARGVAQLRSTLDEAVAGANFLAVQKSRQMSILQLFSELSEELPDHTYLERLHVGTDGLTMSGLSNQAAGLIERLQRSTLVRRPALSGAINPDPRSGKDRFTVSATTGPIEEASP